MATLVPFGIKRTTLAAMQKHAEMEHAAFVRWIDGLQVPEVQRAVLTVLLEMVDRAEFMDGRCAGVTYPAEVARRAGVPVGVDDVLRALVNRGHLSVHPASKVFDDRRPGIVFRLRRPDVVLTPESAGPLWMADSRA
ncbi:hypothetical protein [Arthrobacter bambusae]|uniref:MarR family transcriptional regulator n=1 Tax=Arthrobacter bambusae TaxID=1338426 RepID=A0AAW8D8T0_9MICC|nr:hypothetical protein [Arthrobacter bambusae]MDP9904687.1 hypothetical protein [Arthrobacter bambusae]MDQ0129503.1 hypothetical protein [Arthrobacter bambusae]MDQ0180884.1 hypothetical protein [Arthrobacter bambusae]